ncbi:leucine-rich repeat extensin-like protein 5 [Homarus americanus]|uniref:leucine-rich repeat extensin-like protein 5 n=1 Tax=Homarus americanus TaxID=6706 RepID=UPI001C45AF66|nr:leucine-rich repeat extensin-like protein 5 [Homarus americanus]
MSSPAVGPVPPVIPSRATVARVYCPVIPSRGGLLASPSEVYCLYVIPSLETTLSSPVLRYCPLPSPVLETTPSCHPQSGDYCTLPSSPVLETTARPGSSPCWRLLPPSSPVWRLLPPVIPAGRPLSPVIPPRLHRCHPQWRYWPPPCHPSVETTPLSSPVLETTGPPRPPLSSSQCWRLLPPVIPSVENTAPTVIPGVTPCSTPRSSLLETTGHPQC